MTDVITRLRSTFQAGHPSFFPPCFSIVHYRAKNRSIHELDMEEEEDVLAKLSKVSRSAMKIITRTTMNGERGLCSMQEERRHFFSWLYQSYQQHQQQQHQPQQQQ